MTSLVNQGARLGEICLVGPTASPEEQMLTTQLAGAGFGICSAKNIVVASGLARLSPLLAMLLLCQSGGVEGEPSDAVEYLRLTGYDGLIIVLGSRWEPSFAVKTLNSGADDYIRCPYDAAEVVARIRTLFGRTTGIMYLDSDCTVLLDRARRLVRCADETIALTPKETAVLECLARSLGRVIPLNELVERVWAPAQGTDANKNLVEVYVSYVRRKLARIKCPMQVYTVRGIGYQLASSRVHQPVGTNCNGPGLG